MPKIGNKNDNNRSVPTLAEYITQQIAAKRAAALDKSRNRTSVRVPMVLNSETEEEWRNKINENIKHAKRWIGWYDAIGDTKNLKLAQDFLDKNSAELYEGYNSSAQGLNCMYNAGDCYGLNIPGNRTFAAKHKEKGFKRINSFNMEPGDIVQATNPYGIPVHAMIFDSKDKNDKPLYNYAKGSYSGDFNKDYVKQGRYPMEYNPLVYRYVGTPADSTQWINDYKQKYGNGMRCGGRRKAQLGLDIQYGGRAIPIGKNMVYFDGNSHENGGIGVGNEVEVEGGEVGEYKNNTLRVFSSVPFLRGFSPAQLVMGGANPNKVFKAQENFKDRNRINDDGTHYQNGGQTKSNSAIRTEADKKVPARNRAIYSAVDATSDYPKWWQAVGLGIGSNFKTIINPDSMNYTVTDSVADAAWRKRLGLSYNDKFLIPNKDGSVRLPRNVEMEIPTDTTMLKKRIATNEKFANQSNIVGEDWQIVQAMMKKDKEALEALRKTYKTGEPVVVNEYAHNTRKLSKNGELIDDAINYKSPLNIMRNYTIQYDPKTKKMNYWDTYDFNEFEWGVPGKPFEIKGSIPLKRYGGSMIYTINGNVKNGLMSARPKAQYGKTIKIDRDSYETVDEAVERYKQLYRIKYGKEPSDADVDRVAWTKTIETAFKGNPNLITGYGPNVGVRGPNVTKIVSGANKGKQIARTQTAVRNKNVKSATPQRQAINTKVSQAARNERLSQFERWQQGEAFKASTMPTDAVAVNRPNIGTGVKSGRKGRVDDVVAIERSQRSVDPLSSKSEFSIYDKAYAKKANNKMNQFTNALLASGTGGIIVGNMTYDDIVGDTIYDEEIPVQNNNNKTNKSVNSNIKTQNKPSNKVKVNQNYTINGTFDNARPQYYAKKELPLFGSQSIAEKAGLTRSGWSYADSPTLDYVPNINISAPTNYAKVIGDNTKTSTSSTPRGRGTNTSKATASTKPATVETKQPKLVERPKENLYITGIKNNAVKSPFMAGMEKISAKPASSSTGGETQSKDDNWIPQYNLITGRDLFGVGTNLAGHMISYFANRDILDKYPMPTRPVMAPTVKLKTRVNINPDLTNSKEAELMGIEATNRNTSSSNTSLARNQRIMNESKDARNKLYAYKENAETQLINQDKLNRQGVYARNVAAYNDWLNKTYVAKTNKLLAKQQNLMSLINGIPMAVNNVLGNIETRKSTNDMIRAIAAANPNGDGRLLGIGDYYTQQLANGKIAKYNKNHKFIKYV